MFPSPNSSSDIISGENSHIELRETASQHVGSNSRSDEDEDEELLYQSIRSSRSDADDDDDDDGDGEEEKLTASLLDNNCDIRQLTSDIERNKRRVYRKTNDNDQYLLRANNGKLAKQMARKLSQSSSQVSSSFATNTTTATSSRRTSSVTQLTAQNQIFMPTAAATDDIKYIQASNGRQQQSDFSHSNGLRKLSPRHRTISQSMLELDHSFRSEKFQIKWQNLSFEYQPSLPNRCVRKLKSLLNFKRQEQSQLSPTLSNGCADQQPLVLRDISGSFESNQLVAVIGPSGCGKTTLLQFLAGNVGHQSDRLKIVGLSEPKVAIIGQDDCLLPGLTARETLIYASRLQNGRKHFDHQQHIEPILSELNLLECSNRNVTKLSGGQMKRVTIAQELLYPTNLLILDEVTSGLDASTSFSIVKLLKYLVSDSNYPMSIVMSIHQPSARLFSVFDRVYVMGEGACLYEGSCQVGHISNYLERFGLECPKWHNIADYLIEIACEDSSEQVRQQMIQFQRKQHEQLANHNVVINMDANSPNNNHNNNCDDNLANGTTTTTTTSGKQRRPLASGNHLFDYKGKGNHLVAAKQVLDEQQHEETTNLFDAIERARAQRQRPFWGQFLVHLSRSLLRIRRSYILTYLQLITYILLGFQLATFYGPEIGSLSGCPRLPNNLATYVLASSSSSQGDNDELTQEMRRIQENMNFLLVTVMTATFAALEITVITFPLEAKTVRREWRNGWYRVSSYFMGRTLADLPFQLVFVIIFCLIVYTMTGQIGLASWRFGAFVLTIVFTALIAQSFGLIFGAIFMNNLPAAVFTAPLCIFPALLFSGFFSRVSQIPAFYKPLTYLSHFRYAFDALLVTLYGYERCECDQTILDNYHRGLEDQTSSMRDMFRYLFGSSECPTPTSLNNQPDNSNNQITMDQQQPSVISTTTSSTSSTDLIDRQDFEAIERASREQKAQSFAEVIEWASRPRDSHHQQNDLLIRHERSSQHQGQSLMATGGRMKSFEDVLVDSVFERLQANETSSSLASSIGGTNLTGANLLSANMTSGDNFQHQTAAASQVDFGQGITDHLAQLFSTRLTTMLNKQSNFGHPIPEQCNDFNSYLMNEFNLHNNDLIHGLLMLFAIALITRLICHCILNLTIATRAN